MLELPDVTLVALTNKDWDGHQEAFRKSCEKINFGAVKLIWDEKCTSIDIWNRKIVYELGQYVDTSHAILIHADAEIVHPELWDSSWLELDYLGSPFPLPTDDFSYRDINGDIQRVGNSVGLRSKKLMDLPKKLNMPWQEFHGYWNEDGYISVNMRHLFEKAGCKFGTFEQALKFGKEHSLPENEGVDTFLVHAVG
jgi:hypothetical protein